MDSSGKIASVAASGPYKIGAGAFAGKQFTATIVTSTSRGTSETMRNNGQAQGKNFMNGFREFIRENVTLGH
ncbi:hypothetical protein ACFOLJ_06430 [Rugamonas sp. CCM 8940]|uniref:hypothetical protein n=1 Tax=Rugamonas sp. CCM 8940 TaxID=2765359 RepID=UPI0018F3CB5F|nr:hypothetical protein [Rugamonas sp. CCM 8940]MBJ7310409.1 hypothetical protein [Rugamonas sp. CCM 8940]